MALTFYFCLVSLIVSIPFAANELREGFNNPIEIQHILAGVYTGVVGTGIFYIVYQYTLKTGTELAASLFTYLQPIATILLAAIFLGERITTPFIIGGLFAVIGARLASSK